MQLRALALKLRDSEAQKGPLSDAEILAALMVCEGKDVVELNESPGQQVIAIGTSKWVDAGLPAVEIGHKFASNLLVSAVSEDQLRAVKRPWRSFLVHLPADMIYMSGLGEPVPIAKLLVFEIENRVGDWAFIAWDKSYDLALWRFGRSVEQLMPVDSLNDEVIVGKDVFTDLDLRATALIGRLIVTMCSAMSMPSLLRERNSRVHELWRRAGGDPAEVAQSGSLPMPTYTLGKPVVLDFKERVREYCLTGKHSQVEVQAWVRGHFRTQRHGVKNNLTKTIWLEPYLRGPETAPLLLRHHVLVRKEKD